MMKQLMLVKPGVVTEDQIKKLERKGLVVIETTDFAAFKLINSEFLVASDQFAIAALETLSEYSSYHEKFANRILKAMMKSKLDTETK